MRKILPKILNEIGMKKWIFAGMVVTMMAAGVLNINSVKATNEGSTLTLSLPSSYSSVVKGYVTPVKNQGRDGNCWAFALSTTFETYLKKKLGVDYEFSPKEMDYMFAEGSAYYKYSADNWTDWPTRLRELGGGSNFAYVSLFLGGSHAPVKESVFYKIMQENDSALAAFPTWNDYTNQMTLDWILDVKDEMYQEPLSATNWLKTMNLKAEYLPTDYSGRWGTTDDVTLVKEKVQENGAVYVETWFPTPRDKWDESNTCWDAEHKTIIDKGREVCETVAEGHAAAIVGWDDNWTYYYDTDGDGVGDDERHGAFLIQNSWGPSDMLSSQGITYESLVADGTINVADYTTEELNEIKKLINDYNAYEYVWIGYDYSDASTNTKGEIHFAFIDEIRKNVWDKIYDVINLVGDVKALGEEDARTGFEFTYKTTDETEAIDAVAVGVKGGSIIRSPLGTKITFRVSIDDGSGEYVYIGDADIDGLTYGQRFIKLEDMIEVSGEFKIKIELMDGETPFSNVPDSNISHYTATAYMMDVEEEEEEEEPLPPVVKVPDTGWFTGEGAGMKVVGVIVAALGIAGVMLGIHVYRERRHLFHKIDFKK